LRPALIALYSDEPDATIRARVKADLLPADPPPPAPDKPALIAPLSAEVLAEPGTQAIDRILPAWEAARGWTHRDVQRASGKCSEADLIRFANGTKRANGIVLRHLAQDVFGVPLATFLAGPEAVAAPEPPPPPPEPTDQLVIVYGNAPPVVVACTARDYATLVALVTERAPAREGRR